MASIASQPLNVVVQQQTRCDVTLLRSIAPDCAQRTIGERRLLLGVFSTGQTIGNASGKTHLTLSPSHLQLIADIYEASTSTTIDVQ